MRSCLMGGIVGDPLPNPRELGTKSVPTREGVTDTMVLYPHTFQMHLPMRAKGGKAYPC